MTHGAPDWGVFAAKKTIYLLQDMAELAARIKPVNTFDRSGDVIWWDDFQENIAKWDRVFSGTGAGIALSAVVARSGGLSCCLTLGDAIDDYAYIGRRLPYPVLSKMGFEISFNLHASLDVIEHYIRLYDGTNLYEARIDYEPDTNKLYYLDEDGVRQVIEAALDLSTTLRHFHTIKLVIDAEEGKYHRLILNKDTWDLSAYAMRSAADTSSPYLWISFLARNRVAANVNCYLADAIITQNES